MVVLCKISEADMQARTTFAKANPMLKLRQHFVSLLFLFVLLLPFAGILLFALALLPFYCCISIYIQRVAGRYSHSRRRLTHQWDSGIKVHFSPILRQTKQREPLLMACGPKSNRSPSEHTSKNTILHIIVVTAISWRIG